MEDIMYAAADRLGGEEEHWRLGFNATEFALGLLGQLDIVSDFLFWWSIRKDPDVALAVRWLVFAFALAGAILELICQYLKWDIKVEWKKEKKDNLVLVRQVAIVMLEDIPQMILLLYIVMVEKNGGRWTVWMILSFVIGMISMLFKLCKGMDEHPGTGEGSSEGSCFCFLIEGKNWCICLPGPYLIVLFFTCLSVAWYFRRYKKCRPKCK